MRTDLSADLFIDGVECIGSVCFMVFFLYVFLVTPTTAEDAKVGFIFLGGVITILFVFFCYTLCELIKDLNVCWVEV